jgi:hypothetical protein
VPQLLAEPSTPGRAACSYISSYTAVLKHT